MHQATPLVHEMESDRLFPFFNGLSERYANKSKWKSEVGITPEVVDEVRTCPLSFPSPFSLSGLTSFLALRLCALIAAGRQSLPSVHEVCARKAA